MDKNSIKAFIDSGSILSLSKEFAILGWGKRDWLSQPALEGCHFYAPDFFLNNEKPWFRHANHKKVSLHALRQALLKEESIDASRSKYEWKHSHHPLFNETFSLLQEAYESRRLSKAVPFVFESAEGEMSPAQLVRSLLSLLDYAKKHLVHIYGFWERTSGMLGATPELLFCIKDHRCVETVACAGTRPFQSHENEFVPDGKESVEHALVIQGIREALAPFGELSIGKTQPIALPPIVHLWTPIALNTSNPIPFEQVVRALHPTPALGAYPKDEGMSWLKNYQTKIDRKRFGAPFGCVALEEEIQVCYVAIRNVQWERGKLMLGAGCGIVKTSEREKEWEEILWKLKAIKQILAL